MADAPEPPPPPRDDAPAAWRTRGYMPHFDGAAVVQHVTFHLADSVPADVALRLEAELIDTPADARAAERQRRIHAWVDAGHGSCILRDPAAGAVVDDALRHFDGDRYRLHAWVVMPNHVHAVIETLHRWPLARIVASWKTYTGRRLAARMPADAACDDGRRVWHREYWDRYVRNAEHFEALVSYVEWNPVRAGLVTRPEQWRWGSAWQKRCGGGLGGGA